MSNVTFVAADGLLVPQPPQTLRLVSLHLQQEVAGRMSSINLWRKQQIKNLICVWNMDEDEFYTLQPLNFASFNECKWPHTLFKVIIMRCFEPGCLQQHISAPPEWSWDILSSGPSRSEMYRKKGHVGCNQHDLSIFGAAGAADIDLSVRLKSSPLPQLHHQSLLLLITSRKFWTLSVSRCSKQLSFGSLTKKKLNMSLDMSPPGGRLLNRLDLLLLHYYSQRCSRGNFSYRHDFN